MYIRSLCKRAAGALALAALGVTSQVLAGSGGPISLTGPTFISIPEDGTTHSFDFVLTNNSGAPITGVTQLRNFGFAPSPDPTDQPQFSFGGDCPSTLANGDSCNILVINFTPD